MKKVIGVLIVCMSFVACSGPKTPEFKTVKRARIVGTQGSVYTVSADAIYFNPNSMGGDLTGMEMDIFVDDKKITHLSQDKSAVIPPESEFTVPISFDVDVNKVIKEDKNFLKSALDKLLKQSLEVKYKGHLKATFMTVKFKVPVDYTEEVSLLHVD